MSIGHTSNTNGYTRALPESVVDLETLKNEYNPKAQLDTSSLESLLILSLLVY